MSNFTSQRGSFIHIFNKYGAKTVQDHSFIKILMESAKASKKWFMISKELAEMLVHIKIIAPHIMSPDVEEHNTDDQGVKYIVHVTKDDLVDGKFPEQWQSFMIALTN